MTNPHGERPRVGSSITALLASAWLAGCAAPMPHAEPADVSRALGRWPNTSLAELEQGRSVYLNRCTSCHRPVPPTDLPSDRWPLQVEEMRGRAGLRPQESELLVRYLVALSTRPPPK